MTIRTIIFHSLLLVQYRLNEAIDTSNNNQAPKPKVKIELEHVHFSIPAPYKTQVNTTLYTRGNQTYLYDGVNALNIVQGYNYACYYITCTAPYPIKWITNIPLKKFIEDVQCTNGGYWKYFNSLRLHDDPFKKNNYFSKNKKFNDGNSVATYSIQLMFGLNKHSAGLLKCQSIEDSNLTTHYYFTDDPYGQLKGQIDYLPYPRVSTDEFNSYEIFLEKNRTLTYNGKLIVPCRANRLDVKQSLFMNDEKIFDEDNTFNINGSKFGVKYDPVLGFTLDSRELKETVGNAGSFFGSNATNFRCEEKDVKYYDYSLFVYSTERQTSRIAIVEENFDLASTQSGCILVRNHDKFIFRRHGSDLRSEILQKHHPLKFIQCNSPDECDVLSQCLNFRGDWCYSNRGQLQVGTYNSQWGGVSMETPHNRGLLRCMDYGGAIGFKPIYEYTFIGLDKIRYVLSEDIPNKAIIFIDETPPTLYTNEEAVFRCHIAYFLVVPNIRFALLFKNGTVILQESMLLNKSRSREDLYDTGDISSAMNSNSNLGIGWLKVNVNLTSDSVGIMCFAPLHNSSNWVNATRRFEAKDVKQPRIVKTGGNAARLFLLGDKDFSLHCKAEGAPEPKITWNLPNNQKKTQESTDIGLLSQLIEISNDENGNSFLKFPPMRKTYAGIYTCVAENPFGRDTHEFVLKFQETGMGTFTITGIIFGVITFFGLLAGFLVLWRKYRYARKQLRDLTDEEINEFKNGNGNESDFSDGQVDINVLPFKDRYILDPSALAIEKSAILGKGQFGIVRRGLLDGVAVAVKTTNSVADVAYVKAFLGELKVMSYIGEHPNIVKFVGAIINQIKERSVQAVVELSPFGNLQSYLQKLGADKERFVNLVQNDVIVYERSKYAKGELIGIAKEKKITTLELIDWCRQIANGMEFLASKRVYHGDLASRNVLVFNDNIVKITDFGLSKQLYASESYVKKGKVPLPWRWMAIESLRFLEFSIQSDVWAFAVTVWEIFTLGETPYPGLTWTNDFVNILSNGMRMTKPKYCPQIVYDKMLTCWNIQVDDRPHFPELVEFFQNILNTCRDPSTPPVKERAETITYSVMSPMKVDSYTEFIEYI